MITLKDNILSFFSKNYYTKILLLFIITGFSSTTQAQNNIVVQGKVTDSLQTPLSYANIIAVPESDDLDIKFAITDNQGNYKLALVNNEPYELTVSYLGYTSQKTKGHVLKYLPTIHQQ